MYDFYRAGLINENDDYDILIANNYYGKENLSLEITYDFNDESLKKLKSKYNLEKISGNGSDYIKQIRLMNWVRNTLRPGVCTETANLTTDYILENSLNGLKCNCFMYALVLTDIFLAMGYKSRMITCMPIDLRFDECHCMVLVFSEHFNKKIVFDPALRGLYFGDSNVPLDIKELKNMIIEKRKIRYLWNYIEERKPDTISYLTKNFIRFEYHLNVKYCNHNNNENRTILSLVPLTLPISTKRILTNKICFEYIITHDQDIFWSL